MKVGRATADLAVGGEVSLRGLGFFGERELMRRDFGGIGISVSEGGAHDGTTG